jgi:Icc-related predicted phosphoesterase
MQLAWVTDPHLEWLSDEKLEAFFTALAESETEGIIVSGDISYSKTIKYHLRRFSQLPMPIYFVLGNHDIYESSFAYVHDMVRRSVKDHKNLFWLTESVPIRLTEKTFLVGHDGWADGRAGMGQRSGFLVNDYRAISDFRGLSVGATFSLMQTQADIASRRLRTQISKIIEPTERQHVIVVTHAPPFVKACRYAHGPTSPEYIPHFSNVGMGKALEDVAKKTKARISVLCGHTHEEVRVNINDRIAVWVGPALYGSPSYTTVDADVGC